MNGKYLEPCKRYLLRIDCHQVPVIYDGWGLWKDHGGEEGIHNHAFTRIDTGEWIFRRTARAISRHYDDCTRFKRYMPGERDEDLQCDCQQRLEVLRKPEE